MQKKKKPQHYLTEEQLDYFRAKLIKWKLDLIKESDEGRAFLEENSNEPDPIDSACNLVTQTIELRTKERARKLVKKIDEAIRRIEDGTYGYCEETGNPIGLQRLEARPVATLCIEAQEMHEKKERTYREDALNE